MSKNINIFENAKPQSGEFFKFKNVGDEIQGTYIDVRNSIDSFNNQQTIYVIQDAEGKVWNLGFRQTSIVVHERMNGIKFGQIVGFRFDEERDSKKNPGTKAKIIRIYADPKFVDQEWLAHQKEIEANFASPNDSYTPPVETIPDDEDYNDFTAPLDATPAEGNLPTAEAKSQNEAIDAIRTLAKTKGLTNDKMSEEEADKAIEKYTGLKLEESNLTKIIIALTGYVSK
jgi:hypothetical protein